MTRRVILHVGPHKTASTYLQCRLLLSRGALLQHGFDYPDFGLAQFAHHRLFFFLHERTSATSGIDDAEFRRRLVGPANLVLSSENFSYLAPAHLERLKTLLPDCRFEIVYYLRHPAHLWPSHWQELVRHGRDTTFLEYVGAHCGWTDVFDPGDADAVRQVTKMAACFGAGSLHILCLDNITARGTDVFAHFWQHVLGVPAPAPMQAVPPLNPSLPAAHIEMLRCLNRRYHDAAGKPPGERIVQAYTPRMAEIEALPRFAAFDAAFAQCAVPVTLADTQPLIRQRERVMLRRFGARIENRAGPERIYAQADIATRTLSADRYWPSRFGFADFVDEVLALIVPLDQSGKKIAPGG